MANSVQLDVALNEAIDLIHKVIKASQRVGAKRDFWERLSEDQVLFAQVVSLVMFKNDTNAPQSNTPTMKDIVREAAAELERDLIGKALEESDGNIAQSAKILKIGRKQLQAKIKEFGLAIVRPGD